MIDNIYTFIKHSPPEVANIMLISFLVGLSFAMIPLIWKKSKIIIVSVWIITFLAFFTLAANSVGQSYRISRDIKKKCVTYIKTQDMIYQLILVS